MRIRTSAEIALTLLAGALLAACAGGPAPTPTPVSRPAQVDEVEILILESFPVQVHAVARGNLPDSCTTIAEARTERQGNYFTVTLTTQRPADAICTQVLTPFTETIPLDVAGLPAGVYTVSVNGVTNQFELSVDNIAPASSH